MDKISQEEKNQFALHMASLQSGSPDSYQKRAMEQNLAAEKFIQDLEVSEQRKHNRLKGSIGSIQDGVMEEQTISRYLVKGGSPSLGGDTMQRAKVGHGVADTTDGRRGFQDRKSVEPSPESYQGFALQNIESAQNQASAEFTGALGQQQAPIEVHSFDNRQTSSFQTQPKGVQGPTYEQRQQEYEQELHDKDKAEQAGFNQKDQKRQKENDNRQQPFGLSQGTHYVTSSYEQQRRPDPSQHILISPPAIDANASRPLRAKSPESGIQKSPINPVDDKSHDASFALNDRIKKLKNELRGTASSNTEAVKAGPFEMRSPGSFANTQSLVSRDLRCQIMRQADETDKVLEQSRSRSPVLSPKDPLFGINMEAERIRIENEYHLQMQRSRSRSREDARSSPVVQAPPLRIKHRAQFPGGASPQSNMLIRDSTSSKPSDIHINRNMSADRNLKIQQSVKMGSARGRSNSALQRNSRVASRRTSGSGYRTAGGSQLRKKPSLSSIQNELQAIQIKQVKFQNENQGIQGFILDSENPQQQNVSPNIPQDAVPMMKPPLQSAQDSLNLDKFYQDLIKKERKEFEQVLKSKLCVERAETTKKMRKQIQKASEKLEKVSELEKHLKYAKNNNERLRIEWEAMKSQLGQTEKTLSLQVQENQLLRNKLDALWDKYEDEKDIVMLVTKAEVEKSKHQELEALQLRLDAAHEHNEHLTSRVSHMATIQEENQESVAERSKLVAEKEVLESKVDRLELENKRLKDELEKSQEAQMTELRQKYELMKQKYAQMANSSSQLRQLLVDGKESSIRPHTDSALEGSLNGPYQSQPLLNHAQNMVQADIQGLMHGTEGLNTLTLLGKHSNNETRSNRSRSKTRGNNRRSSVASKDIAPLQQVPRATLGKQTDSVEVWRLRCKLLAEKYFNIIRDLKVQLQTVKQDAQRNLQETRKELGNQLMLELKKYILKIDQRATAGKNMKQQAKEFIATQDFKLADFDNQLEGQNIRNERKIATQGADLITPAFQSRENLVSKTENNGHSVTQNFSSDVFGLGGFTEDYNRGQFGISPLAGQLNLYSAASSPFVAHATELRQASMSPTRISHVVNQEPSGYQSVPQQQISTAHRIQFGEMPLDPKMLSQYGRSYSKPRGPPNPAEISVLHAERSTDSQPFYVKNTILRNESLQGNEPLPHQPSTNSQISPSYTQHRPLHLMNQPSISKASRLSSNSRDRPVEQTAFINGQPHRMAALRSKSPTATNHSYTSQKMLGSVIERSEREAPSDNYIQVYNQRRELSNGSNRYDGSIAAKNHKAHKEIMQVLHQQQNNVPNENIDRERGNSRGSRNESYQQPVSFQRQSSSPRIVENFQKPVFHNKAIQSSGSHLAGDQTSLDAKQQSHGKRTMLQAAIQESSKKHAPASKEKTFQTQQTSNKSVKQSIRENIRSQRKLDLNRGSSIKSRQSSVDQQITSNAQLEGGIASKSLESIEASKRTLSRKSRFEQYSQKDSYDRLSQKSKSRKSTLSNNIQGEHSRSRDSQKNQTVKFSNKQALPYENVSNSAAQETKQVQLKRIISPTDGKKSLIAEYENYNQDIQDVANSAASFRHLTGNENTQFMGSIDTDKIIYHGSQQFIKTQNPVQSGSDPSGENSQFKTTWNRTGQFSGHLNPNYTQMGPSALVSIEQDQQEQQQQNGLDQNQNTFEDLDEQIQKSIASLKKMGGQSSKHSSIERSDQGVANKYKQKKKSSISKGSSQGVQGPPFK